jgi:hypothetical protein
MQRVFPKEVFAGHSHHQTWSNKPTTDLHDMRWRSSRTRIDKPTSVLIFVEKGPFGAFDTRGAVTSASRAIRTLAPSIAA